MWISRPHRGSEKNPPCGNPSTIWKWKKSGKRKKITSTSWTAIRYPLTGGCDRMSQGDPQDVAPAGCSKFQAYGVFQVLGGSRTRATTPCPAPSPSSSPLAHAAWNAIVYSGRYSMLVICQDIPVFANGNEPANPFLSGVLSLPTVNGPFIPRLSV